MANIGPLFRRVTFAKSDAVIAFFEQVHFAGDLVFPQGEVAGDAVFGWDDSVCSCMPQERWRGRRRDLAITRHFYAEFFRRLLT